MPTRLRAGYLDVALASIAPQAAAAGAELVVVDDGPDEPTRVTAQRHGARYVAHEASRGLNAARNSGIDAAAADLLVFVDDDVEVRPGWLDALLAADAAAAPEVGVLTGPIHARFEDHRLRSCGREDPPITTQDHGPEDRDVFAAWGANMTRAALGDRARRPLRRGARAVRRRAGVAGPAARQGRADPLRRGGGARPSPRRRRRAPALARRRRLPARRGQPALRRLQARRAVAAARAARARRLRPAHGPLRVPERDRADGAPARSAARGARRRRPRGGARSGLPVGRERDRARPAPPADARARRRARPRGAPPHAPHRPRRRRSCAGAGARARARRASGRGG